jgi:hypothetical protein
MPAGQKKMVSVPAPFLTVARHKGRDYPSGNRFPIPARDNL